MTPVGGESPGRWQQHHARRTGQFPCWKTGALRLPPDRMAVAAERSMEYTALSTGCMARLALLTTLGVAARFTARPGCMAQWRCFGELPGAEQAELDSAGDVPDGRFAGPGAGCPRVDAWPLVTVRQAPGRGGNGPECGRRSARCIQGHDRSGSRPSSGCRHQSPLAPPGSSSRYTSPLPSGSAKKNIGGEPSRCKTSSL